MNKKQTNQKKKKSEEKSHIKINTWSKLKDWFLLTTFDGSLNARVVIWLLDLLDNI